MLSFVACNTEEAPRKAPNILFILTDDLGVRDLGFTGSRYYETPHLDRLAALSMVFDQGYACSRVCSPSRASIMTGQFTARHGITDWIGSPSGTDWLKNKRPSKVLPAQYLHELPKENVTMAEAFQEEGYKTFFAGKWHLGSEGSYPEDHGFAINAGGWERGGPVGGYFSPYQNPRLKDGPAGENLTMRLASETAAFIESHKDSTFFAFLSFYAVHGPIQTTHEQWKKYRDKAANQGIAETGYQMAELLPIRQVQDNPVYAGLVESMDDAVGVVLDKLQELGLMENTIVVFTSDNGGVASGDSFSTSNLPYRGGKGYQYEGGIREPFLIYAPGRSAPGQSTDYPVTGADFYPTLLDLAGLPMRPDQHIDGLSLKPIMEGNTLSERALYWHYPHYGNQGGLPSSILRDGDWKLIHYWEDDHNELYNLKTDPYEAEDMASVDTARTNAMAATLMQWLKQQNARYPVYNEYYDAGFARNWHKRMVEKVLPEKERERQEMLRKDFMPNADWWGSTVD